MKFSRDLLIGALLCAFAILAWLLVLFTAVAGGAEARLEWDAVTNGVAGYRLHSGPAPRAYTDAILIPGPTNTHGSMQITGLTYFAATSFDDQFNTSEFSDEVSAFIVSVQIESACYPDGPWALARPAIDFVTSTNEPARFFRAKLEIIR